ncbi:MAG TPA: hypothetical protein VF817_01190 [Patescibacteria group bacterium]
MRKCIETGNRDVAEYIVATYKLNRTLCLSWDYPLYAPMDYDIFEVIEPLEYPNYENNSVSFLEPGIYKVVRHIGWIWDTYYPIHVDKYVDGSWKERRSVTIAVDGGLMMDWRGTRPADIQLELPL